MAAQDDATFLGIGHEVVKAVFHVVMDVTYAVAVHGPCYLGPELCQENHDAWKADLSAKLQMMQEAGDYSNGLVVA